MDPARWWSGRKPEIDAQRGNSEIRASIERLAERIGALEVALDELIDAQQTSVTIPRAAVATDPEPDPAERERLAKLRRQVWEEPQTSADPQPGS